MRAVVLPLVLLAGASAFQDPHAGSSVPLQPLAQTVRRLESALAYLGQPLPAADHEAINEAVAINDEDDAVARIEAVLDRHALLVVRINPESRVSVEQGAVTPELVEEGTRLFLVKVLNAGGVRAPLVVESPQSGAMSVASWQSDNAAEPPMTLTPAQAKDKWADISLYEKSPFSKTLTGLALEYRILEVFSRDAGQRAAQIAFNVGQGTQDIGFRNDVLVVFNARPARDVLVHVTDADGKPGMASFVVRDAQGRIHPSPSKRLAPDFPRPLRAALCAQAGPIIHCAADTRFSERNRRDITATNVHGLRGILNLAAASRASFFHYISTAYVAGRTSGCCSEHLVRTSDFTNVYEETKARAEHEVAAHCAREGLAHTIIRPSIVYGDSRTGRSTRFTALYYPVKSLLCLRDIYLDDIRHHGGKKAQACGILLEDGGVLRLPLRIFLARRGQVNLIPIDYFVAAVMTILERAEAGTVYHLTSESPTTIDDLAAYSQAFLKVAGLEIIDGPPNGARLTPPEAIFQRFIEPYLPYLADTRSFDRRHAHRATVGLNPPELTYEVFERCMGYAMSANWGNGGQAPAA